MIAPRLLALLLAAQLSLVNSASVPTTCTTGPAPTVTVLTGQLATYYYTGHGGGAGSAANGYVAGSGIGVANCFAGGNSGKYPSGPSQVKTGCACLSIAGVTYTIGGTSGDPTPFCGYCTPFVQQGPPGGNSTCTPFPDGSIVNITGTLSGSANLASGSCTLVSLPAPPPPPPRP